MELVEGDTLADRVSRGRLPASDALTIARQVAEAIEAAHARGIVHRDLKPANIMITPGGAVKVLDFGLAKGTETGVEPVRRSRGDDGSHAPTFADPAATERGMILGTPSYMSPQQARGQAVAKDADVWAFGCVLFEMLAGQRAFAGGTATDIVAGVLQSEPDWSALPASTPPAAVRLLRRCLMKDPARRLRDIADARLEIEDLIAAPAADAATETSPAPAAAIQSRRPWAVAAVMLVTGVAAGVAGQRWLDSRAAPAGGARASVFGINEPPGESLYLFAGPVSLSPDGRQMAIVTNGVEGQPRLWLRSLDDPSAKRLDAADGAMFPFWSPDGRSLAFVAHGELRVMDVASRTVRTLAASPTPMFGGAWNGDGTILFADIANGLKRVPATGGTPVAVASPGPAGEKLLTLSVQFLPDGRHFIYFAASMLPGRSAAMLGSLDSPERREVFKSDTQVLYAPGFLVYGRGGDVVAHRFDPSSFALSGDPVVVGQNAWLSSGLTGMSVSTTGVLAFATERAPTTELTWLDRAGKPLGTLGEPGRWIHVAVSPDGRAVAAERLDERTGAGVTWTMDAARGAPSRLSLRPGWTMLPTWSPRGDRIAMASTGESIALDLITAAADGSGREDVVLPNVGLGNPTDWLPDQAGLVFNTSTTTAGSDILSIRFEPGSKPAALVQTPFNDVSGKVSPDGRWLAYVSNESGREEVYVRQLAGGAGRWRVSQTGGTQPRWRRDGRELFFVSPTRRIMASAIAAGAALDAAAPVELPIETAPDLLGGRLVYDVADDGRRFLVIRRISQALPEAITVVLDWPALVKP
jgi:Tol biopolymer transport system component